MTVIAGSLNNLQAPAPTPDSWAADADNGVAILTIKLEANATWVLPKVNSDVNRTLFFYKGDSMQIEGETISVDHLIQINPGKDVTLQGGNETCNMLMLQGKPINEPVAQYGPFVMNTEEEIREAYQDYQRTQFGGWPWPKHEQSHDRNKGRFALHADGKEENFNR